LLWIKALGGLSSKGGAMAASIHIAVYSHTGHTRDAGTRLASLLGPLATVESIEALNPPVGAFGYMRGGFGALTGRAWPNRPVVPRAGQRLLVVGSPVWAGHLPPPVRSYLRQAAAAYPLLAMLVTEGGSNLAAFNADVAAAAGKSIAAAAALTDADRKASGMVERKLGEFAAALKRMI
jgi:hypothetical protein